MRRSLAMVNRPIRRLGLRARLTLSFALGAALLSVVLSVITWSLTRENLLRQRDDIAVSRVLLNAVTVRSNLGGASSDVEAILASLPTPEGAQPVVFSSGVPSARNPAEFNQDSIPAVLRATVDGGDAARMRTDVDGEPYLIVGVPIPAVDAAYYEGVPLADVERTLDGLAISLLGAAAITTLAGGLVGFWAARRVLVPLAGFGRAAEAIAGGRLDTRLKTGIDPDLDPLIVSFNEMAAGLQSRIERDARFASEVSHELRSPLMTLSASIEVLQNSRDDLSERSRAALDLLVADVDRFQRLVEDLLEISRFDVGAITLHLSPVLVTELVLQSVAGSGYGAIPVEYEEDVDEVAVLVDKTRFFRVIGNLLENADRYAGGATSVQVFLVEDAESGDRVGIAVEDAGHGVPEAERSAIFDRFSRGTEGGNRGSDSGTGLGLALVDEHIRLHGGRVWVEDRLDGRAGARFVIELPVLGDDALDDLEDDEEAMAVTTTDLDDLAEAGAERSGTTGGVP